MQCDLIENDFCKLWIEGEVLCCKFQPYLEIDMPVIKKCVSERISFTNGTSYTMLADIKYLKYFTSDAKEYLASKEGCKDLLAIAFLVSTQIEKFMIKLFIEVNHPNVPCAVFADKKQALEWLSLNNIKGT